MGVYHIQKYLLPLRNINTIFAVANSRKYLSSYVLEYKKIKNQKINYGFVSVLEGIVVVLIIYQFLTMVTCH